MPAPVPKIGDTVHYVSHGTPVLKDGSQAFASQCRAAVVTEVGSTERYLVGLAVLNPTGQFFHSIAQGGCRFDEWDGTDTVPGAQPQSGSWHWPERGAS